MLSRLVAFSVSLTWEAPPFADMFDEPSSYTDMLLLQNISQEIAAAIGNETKIVTLGNQAALLASLFRDNFTRFADQTSEEIAAAGPV